MVELNEKNLDEFLKGNKKVLVDLWAPWCGPCRMLGPVLEEVENENEGIKLVKINIDENPSVADRFNCMSIPMVLLFENGETKKQFVGYNSKEFVEEFIK